MKRIVICLAMTLLSFTALALSQDLAHAPKNFVKNNKPYIFVDFASAHYKIEYHVDKKQVHAWSTITFSLPQNGYPLYDFSANKQRHLPLEVEVINTKTNKVKAKITSSSIRNPIFDNTSYRTFSKPFVKGIHTVRIKTKIDNLIKFQGQSVTSAFWLSDLSDRSFLEKYLPSNLDYDRYKMSFDVKVLGTKVAHSIITNCISKRVSSTFNQSISHCSPFFNSASLFFHVFPTNKYTVYKRSFKSIDGRTIPILIYGKSAKTLLKQTPTILRELEADYGPWPHPQLIVFGTGPFTGGMEYSGATTTSVRALGHELHHSYFARSMFPAGGNAGWIDEALASWRDNNYPKKRKLNTATRMGGHSIYRRDTDRLAYTKGAEFIAYLDNKFSKQGGMKKFKKDVLAKGYRVSHMTTPKFKALLEKFFNADLKSLFDTYIYGINLKTGKRFFSPNIPYRVHNHENSYHKILSERQMLDLI